MNRTKGILTAGTLTGLVLLTVLALGFGNLRAEGTNATAVPTTTTVIEAPLADTNGLANEEALQAWQQYSAELEQTVRTMQERETTYQAQIEGANQTILQLQNDINRTNSAPAIARFSEHEEHEEHDDD